MKRALFSLFAVVIMAFGVCCAHRPVVAPFPYTDDVVARERQLVATSVVEVVARGKVAAAVEVIDGDKTVKIPKVASFVEYGTGSIVRNDSKRSFIITNHHVCFPDEEFPEGATAVERSWELSDIRGKKSKGRVVFFDMLTDTCVLTTDRLPFPALSVANEEAPFGARVFRYGNDSSLYFAGLMIMVEGTFDGFSPVVGPFKVSRAIFSIPTGQGASGGPILYRGQIVALTEAIQSPHPSIPTHMVVAVRLHHISSAIRSAIVEVEKSEKKGDAGSP